MKNSEKIEIEYCIWLYWEKRWNKWEYNGEIHKHNRYRDDFYWLELGLPIYLDTFSSWYRKVR